MVSGRRQQCRGPSHRQPARKFRGLSVRSESGRAIGAALRSPGSDGSIRRKPMELWDETPTAAQAAVGVSVCGAPPEIRIVLETVERARLVVDLLTELP